MKGSEGHQRMHDQRCCKQWVNEWRLLASGSGVKVLAYELGIGFHSMPSPWLTLASWLPSGVEVVR